MGTTQNAVQLYICFQSILNKWPWILVGVLTTHLSTSLLGWHPGFSTHSLWKRNSSCQKYTGHFTYGLSSLRCCCRFAVVACENGLPLSEAWECYGVPGGTYRLFSWPHCQHCSTFHFLMVIFSALSFCPSISALFGSVANPLVGQNSLFCLVREELRMQLAFTLSATRVRADKVHLFCMRKTSFAAFCGSHRVGEHFPTSVLLWASDDDNWGVAAACLDARWVL